MGKRTAGAFIFVAGLMSVTMASVFFQQAGSGMAGYWKCDDVAAPTTDSSGVVNDGAWISTVTSLTGAANTPQATAFSTGCLNFSSATAQVSVPGTAALTITGDFTVAFWMYPNADGTDWQRLVGKGNSLDRTFGVWREPNAGHHILFQQYNAGSAVINITTAATTPNTAWTHVACRISGTTATVFLNGASSASGTRSGLPSTVVTDPLTFAYAGFHTSFPGRLDDIRVYNRALADSDISALAAGNQGPNAPASLVATAGSSQVALTWIGSATFYNVKRATVPGGPYTTIASNVATTNYTDNTVVAGTYYYVVSGVTYGEGPDSTEVSAVVGQVTALPNTGLFTNENGATTSFNVKFNLPAPGGGSVVQVVSNNTTEGVVSTTFAGATPIANGFQIMVAAGLSPTIPVTVTGVDDAVFDGNVPYTISVTASGFAGLAIPNVSVTNNDNDIPGITFSRTSGLVTNESGGQDTFTVSLNTQPFGTITMSLTSSNPAEGTVSPASLTFTPGAGPNAWNAAHLVTLTGVDDTVLDFTQTYTIVTGTLGISDVRDNAGYNFDPPDVSASNIDNEAIPALPHVWGGGGGGGGCGLLGAEIALPLLLLGLLRRRRRA
jgi:hypothetical protein